MAIYYVTGSTHSSTPGSKPRTLECVRVLLQNRAHPDVQSRVSISKHIYNGLLKSGAWKSSFGGLRKACKECFPRFGGGNTDGFGNRSRPTSLFVPTALHTCREGSHLFGWLVATGKKIVELLISAGANLHLSNKVSIFIELAHAADIWTWRNNYRGSWGIIAPCNWGIPCTKNEHPLRFQRNLAYTYLTISYITTPILAPYVIIWLLSYEPFKLTKTVDPPIIYRA